jgi:two-component system response regulator NreC
MNKLRVLIVDDHALVRAGIRSLIEGQSGFEVVGEAAQGDEVLGKVMQLQPDVVLMDIAMPGMNGIEATKLLKREFPHIHVIILTMHDDEEFFFTLIREGASGYILKDSEPEQLVSAIRNAAKGQIYLSPAVAKALMESYVMATTGLNGENHVALTSREKDVMRLLAAGQTNREIAEALVLSRRTVEKHRQALTRKLGLSNRDDLTRYAIRRGLIEATAN